MRLRERLEAAIDLKVPDRVPVVPLIAFFAARYAEMPIKDYLLNPKRAEEATEKTFEGLGGWDAWGFPPIGFKPSLLRFVLALANPLRVKLPGVDLPPDTIYQFVEEPVMTVDDYDEIVKMGYQKWYLGYIKRMYPKMDYTSLVGKLKMILNLLAMRREMKRVKEKWERRGVPFLFGGSVSQPFETFSLARSVREFSVDLYRRPEKIIQASDVAVKGIIDIGKRAAKGIGIPRIFVSCVRGSADFISPKIFETFFLPYLRKIVEEFAKEGYVSLLHLDDNYTPFLAYFRELPKKKCIFESDGCTNIFEAKRILGDNMCIMGDVPANLLAQGTQKEVEKYCKKLIDKVGEGGGFILSSGCEVPVDAKPENVKAMIDTAKTYGVYKR